ncbi:MAG: hypothetical protein NTV81_01720 [Candidatus Komeilibacteria bacterium]|nr:hypothetical protein [Candidatus Komeilibacteria bacterium]
MDDGFIKAVMRFHELRLIGEVNGLVNFLVEVGMPTDEARRVADYHLKEPLAAPSLAKIEAAVETMRQIDADFRAGRLNRRGRRRQLRASQNLFTVAGLWYPGSSSLAAGWPRNKFCWYLLRHAFGAENFDFLIPDGACHAPGRNRIEFPALMSDSHGEQLPLVLAAAGLIDGVSGLPAHIIKKASRLVEDLGNDLGLNLIRVLFKAKIVLPPDKVLAQLISVIKRGLAGEEVVLASVICPDYGYVPTGNIATPYRYTFDSLGSGIGLVAQQVVRLLPPLVEFFREAGIKHRVVLAIGDFERNSPEICRRVGCDQVEFLNRCQGSLVACQQSLPEIPIESLLFQEQWANGRWLDYLATAIQEMKAGKFGLVRARTGKDPDREILFIATDSQSFYDHWYDRHHVTEELLQLVIAQAAEYAAVGRIMGEDFSGQPLIQIAGDRPKMHAFDSMYPAADFPTLCAERSY